jgi:hypothetical protein
MVPEGAMREAVERYGRFIRDQLDAELEAEDRRRASRESAEAARMAEAGDRLGSLTEGPQPRTLSGEEGAAGEARSDE